MTDETHIYHQNRGLSPKHNYAVSEELDMILYAGVVSAYVTTWASQIVIAKKKDGSPRFCVDYSTLKRIMKPEKQPIPSIKDIFHDLADSDWFTTLVFFSGY